MPLSEHFNNTPEEIQTPITEGAENIALNEDNITETQTEIDNSEAYLRPERQDAKEFSETELAQRLKDIKDINELKKALNEIIGSMESQIIKITKELNKDNNEKWRWAYNWIAEIEDDYWDTYSIFEKKWLEIIDKAKDILAQIEQWNAEVNLLTFLQQSSAELFQVQNEAENQIRNDIKDWNISYKDFISKTSIEYNYEKWWSLMFSYHNNPTKFKEYLKSKSNADLIWSLFSIKEWAWAFNDWYTELKRRLNWKNLFTEIDDIAANWHDRELDWTTDIIEKKAVRGMLRNGKINDLNNYLSTYKDSERIINDIRKELRHSIMDSIWIWLDETAYIWDFLKHFNEVKKSSMLWDLAREIEKSNPVVQKFEELEKNIHNQQLDILKDKKVNALILFDNDDLAWSWKEYFKPNIAKFKSQWYKEVERTNTEDLEKVVLKKWDDKITLWRLKCDKDDNLESYDKAISSLKDNNYNLFALRWHCYNTSEIAPRLWENWMLKEWSILIDWWCWIANSHLDEYIKWWITCPIFSYTNTWKWETTEALFNIILKEKDKWWNLWTLLNSVKQAMKSNSPVLKWMSTMNMPDSPYTLFSLANYKSNKTLADNWETDDDTSDQTRYFPIDSSTN